MATQVLEDTVVSGLADLNESNRFKINGVDYFCYFEISPDEDAAWFVEPDEMTFEEARNKIRLTKSAIVNLDIVENVFEPFVSGHITVNNPFDYIEDNHFTRGDGTDYLHVLLCEWEDFHSRVSDTRNEKTGARYIQPGLT